MRARRMRLLSGITAIGLAGGLSLTGAASAPALATGPPPWPSREGPAGPPALLPNGQPAAPPRVSSPQISTGCPAPSRGANFYAPGTGKTVALTFDDGPGASTASILSILRAEGVTATFFNIGQNAPARPQLVGSEARTGYQVGNHTWNHPNMSTLSAAAQAGEMDRATAEQKTLIGAPPCAFRPPGGSYNSSTRSLAQQRRMKLWLWSVDTEDWKANGSGSSYWVKRIIRLAEQEGGPLRHPVVLMHNQPAGNPATVAALPTIIRFFRHHGYRFVNLLANTGAGYLVLSSQGGVRNLGTTWHGSVKGHLASGARAIGLAADPATGGYWILKSGGGVAAFSAPWRGSANGTLAAGDTAAAIAGSRGGYLILTSNGGVRNFGTPWHGSDGGHLPSGVKAIGLAADFATGGYWILRSNGGVDAFHAPWHGSLRGHLPTGRSVVAITAAPGGGYWILASNGGVYNFGAPWHGSDNGKLAAGVTPVGLAAAPATGGYWILKSGGGVDRFHAPWHGSLTGTVPAGNPVTAIAGQ